MSGRTNSKVTVQCENDDQLDKLMSCLRREFAEYLVFDSGTRKNSREPYPEGKHAILYFFLPQEGESNE